MKRNVTDEMHANECIINTGCIANNIELAINDTTAVNSTCLIRIMNKNKHMGYTHDLCGDDNVAVDCLSEFFKSCNHLAFI